MGCMSLWWCWAAFFVLPAAANMTVAECFSYAQETDLVKSKYCKLKEDLSVKTPQACEGVDNVEVDRNTKQLEGLAGEENIVELSLIDSSSVGDKVTPGWALATAGSFVMLPIMFFVWFICCWSMCPCCACCRVNVHERRLSQKALLIILVIIVVLVIVFIICSGVALAGAAKMGAGVDRFFCAAMTMMDVVLSGEGTFLGLLRSTVVMSELSKTIETDGAVIVGLRNITNQTSGLEQAQGVLLGTMQLLQDAVTKEGNKFPGIGTAYMTHKNYLCEMLEQLLGPTLTALSTGLGQALVNVRKKMNQLFFTDNGLSTKLDSALNAMMPAIDDMVRELSKATDSLSKEGTISTKNSFKSGVVSFSAILLVFSVLLGLCGGLSVCGIAAGENSGKPKRAAHCCACCGCCCGFLFTVMSFFIGGLLVLVAVPASGVCLVMDGISSEKLASYKSLNVSADVGKLVDACLIKGASGDLLNAISMDVCKKNGTSRPSNCSQDQMESVGMGTGMKEQFFGSINSSFAELESKMVINVNLRDSEGVVALLDMLGQSSASRSFILDAMANEKWDLPPYNGMKTWEHFNKAVFTTLACANSPMPNKEPYTLFPTQVQSGLGYKTIQDHIGGAVACGQDWTCTGDATLCAAADKVLSDKEDIKALGNYDCPLFFDASGAVCDVKDMATASPWANDCIRERTWATGDVDKYYMRPMARQCNFTDFEQYLKNFKTSLDKSFRRYDHEVETLGPRMSNGMRQLVQKEITDRLTKIIDGVDCVFMGTAYRQTIDGLCFQMVRGLGEAAGAFVAFGVFGLLYVIFSYILWRIAIDNYVTSANGRLDKE